MRKLYVATVGCRAYQTVQEKVKAQGQEVILVSVGQYGYGPHRDACLLRELASRETPDNF